MKTTVFIVFSIFAAFGAAYPTKETVNCRSGPGTSYSVTKSIAQGTDVKISCQTTGETIKGNNIWDKLSDGCYVADYYIKTGVDGFVTDKCGSSGDGGSSGPIPGPMKDDYPYKSTCGAVDPWRYYECQCTSFVAYRINSRLGIHFTNTYKGHAWGNANTWDSAAQASGVTMNKTPKPGCIAQSNVGSAGHVAWVSAVNGDMITVEEYNWNPRLKYGVRTVNKSAFDNYIHLNSKV